MQITNKQALDCYLGCSILAKEKLPIHISFKIEILRQNLEPLVNDINYKIDCIKLEYCEKDENESPIFQKNNKNESIPNAYIFSQENSNSANNLINELLNSNIEFVDLKIKITEFPANCEISADTLKLLRRFIEL